MRISYTAYMTGQSEQELIEAEAEEEALKIEQGSK
jgi:hypothetical protein